jgi:hypothetical protein
MTNIFPNDINFRLYKILDIGYICAIYCIAGIFVSRILDFIFIKYDKLMGNDNTKKPYIVQLLLEIICMYWIIGTTTYIIRNIIELIPSPFEGFEGLIHKRVKELGSAVAFTFIVMNSTSIVVNKVRQFNHDLNTYLNIL